MQDPYVELLSAMQRQGKSVNPPGIRLAEIVSPPPNIIIKMVDLQIDKDNILIADYLLPGYRRNITMPLTDSQSEETDTVVGDHGSHTHDVTKIGVPAGTMQLTDTLKSGDTVAVMPTTDGQTYIILAKVVRL